MFVIAQVAATLLKQFTQILSQQTSFLLNESRTFQRRKRDRKPTTSRSRHVHRTMMHVFLPIYLLIWLDAISTFDQIRSENSIWLWWRVCAWSWSCTTGDTQKDRLPYFSFVSALFAGLFCCVFDLLLTGYRRTTQNKTFATDFTKRQSKYQHMEMWFTS